MFPDFFLYKNIDSIQIIQLIYRQLIKQLINRLYNED